MRHALFVFVLMTGCGSFDFGHYPDDGEPPPSPVPTHRCDGYGDPDSCAAAGCDALACDACGGTSYQGCFERGTAPDCQPLYCPPPIVVTCGALDETTCYGTSGCASIYDSYGGFVDCTEALRSCVVDPVDAGCGDGYPLCAGGYDYLLDDNGCPAGCVEPSLCSPQD